LFRLSINIILLVIRVITDMRVFEDRVLRKIFGPKRDEVTGEWRRLNNEELYALYTSPNTIRVTKSSRMRWVGHVARTWDRKVASGVWVGIPEGRKPLGKPTRRWEDNVKMGLQEVGWGGNHWIDLAQDRDT
jgi:hypothetical protein